MANAQTTKAWRDATNVYLAAAVIEQQIVDGVSVSIAVEYIGTMLGADFDALPTAATKKAAMVAAVKAVRDLSLLTPTAVPGITGTIAV